MSEGARRRALRGAMKLLQRRPAKLAAWVPYLRTMPATDDGVVMTRAGGLLRVARLEGPDLETASAEALVGHDDRMSRLWGRLDSGVSVLTDNWRFKEPQYLRRTRFNGVWAAEVVDGSRRKVFEDAALPNFGARTYLAVHQVPRQRDVILRWMRGHRDSPISGIVKGFQQNSEQFFREVALSARSVEVLEGDALAGYLHATVNWRVQRKVMLPSGSLSHQLANSIWVNDPSLKVDKLHLATVELVNLGKAEPDSMQALHELPFECRWASTLHAMTLEEQRQEIALLRRQWRGKQKNLGAYLAEIWTKNPYAGRTNPEADAALLELDELEANLTKNPFGVGHVNVHVWDEDETAAMNKAETVRERLSGAGFLARVADLNAFGAAIGDMPGNVTPNKRNERRPNVPVKVITRTSALTGIASGAKEDRRWGGPALLVAHSRRGTPFWWSMNAPGTEDAHTVVVGKTGSGKSTLLALMAMGFMRYERARVVFIDRFGSFMVPCLAMGGEWVDLGDGGPGVQPLRRVDQPDELAWAQAYVEELLARVRVTVDTRVRGDITDGLREVAACDPDDRTLTRLYTFLAGSEDARQGLRHWCEDGPYGKLFDGVVRARGAEARVLGIDTARIAGLGDAHPLALEALFQAIERDVMWLPGPKQLILDEASSYFNSPFFRPRVESAVREGRKKNMALVVATQDPVDLQGNVGRIVAGQSGNRVWCPHPEAIKPDIAGSYLQVGVTEDHVRQIAQAQPKCDYLIQAGGVDRWVSIRLEDEALRFCGAGVGPAHRRARELLAQGHAPGKAFAQAWLAETTEEWIARTGDGDEELKEAA